MDLIVAKVKYAPMVPYIYAFEKAFKNITTEMNLKDDRPSPTPKPHTRFSFYFGVHN